MVVEVVAGGGKAVEVKGTRADDAAGELVECGAVLGFEVAGATVPRAVVSGAVAAAVDAADVVDTAELTGGDDWAAEVMGSAAVEEPLVFDG